MLKRLKNLVKSPAIITGASTAAATGLAIYTGNTSQLLNSSAAYTATTVATASLVGVTTGVTIATIRTATKNALSIIGDVIRKARTNNPVNTFEAELYEKMKSSFEQIASAISDLIYTLEEEKNNADAQGLRSELDEIKNQLETNVAIIGFFRIYKEFGNTFKNVKTMSPEQFEFYLNSLNVLSVDILDAVSKSDSQIEDVKNLGLDLRFVTNMLGKRTFTPLADEINSQPINKKSKESDESSSSPTLSPR